jgi:hypothetical protein
VSGIGNFSSGEINNKSASAPGFPREFYPRLTFAGKYPRKQSGVGVQDSAQDQFGRCYPLELEQIAEPIRFFIKAGIWQLVL